jgi:hypothetical protein
MRRPDTDAVITSRSVSSAPAGYRFPREVIAVAVRWYLRYGLSYRDVEELLAERGIAVDHVTSYRWVQTFTAELIDAARPARHVSGDRWLSIRPTARSRAAGRSRSPPSQREAAADARTQTPGLGADHRCRARLRAEPAPRPLRNHPRPARAGSGPRRIRGARPAPLTAGTAKAIDCRRPLPSPNATPPPRPMRAAPPEALQQLPVPVDQIRCLPRRQHPRNKFPRIAGDHHQHQQLGDLPMTDRHLDRRKPQIALCRSERHGTRDQPHELVLLLRQR